MVFDFDFLELKERVDFIKKNQLNQARIGCSSEVNGTFNYRQQSHVSKHTATGTTRGSPSLGAELKVRLPSAAAQRPGTALGASLPRGRAAGKLRAGCVYRYTPGGKRTTS